MVAEHLEGHRVSAGLPDVVDVLHPDAGLAHDERVGWRRGLAGRDVWLEVVDRRLREQHVVPPAVRRDGVGLDAVVALALEVRQHLLAHLRQRVLLAEAGVVDELVVLTGRFAAGLSGVVPGPEVSAALHALLPGEPLLLEVFEAVGGFEVAHWE